MRLIRLRTGDRIATGVLEGDVVRPLRGTFFEAPVPTGEVIPVDEVRLLAPVIPSKVVCVGKNYLEHAQEMGGPVPEEPILFMKPSTAVIGPGDPIPRPSWVGRVDHEGELGIVIGRLARHVRVEEAFRVILGYTCGNDVTARDLQAADGQWTRAKGFDGFCPLGPWIETELDPTDVAVECRVNGETRQAARTSQLAFGPAYLVAYVTRAMTLLPGDVILTGTPAGVGPVAPGDRVEVEVEGVGVLRNPVVEDRT
jgi:2-keto-4-pentenoate hydratase/2-oxohepta-3-ene-1,7-dioic acid hydratase in catechol pathway